MPARAGQGREPENRAEALGKRIGFNACNGQQHKTECAGLQTRLNTRAALDTAAGISFASSVAIGSIALSTLLWDRHETKPAPVRVLPTATPQDAGVTLHARW
ncbi:MAG TPA: hypothetical protein VLS89_04965 [Candidatus Nanopelagicales bacterium]|nr:hypothetical protein [Candidatus Nanopelagicales bacterium]